MRFSLEAVSRGAFVGRARELSLLAGCHDEGRRLVTITGPAGIGKTRLSVEWARSLPARVLFCDLSEARSVGDVCAIVARALGAPLSAAGSEDLAVEQIGRALAAAGSTVLLLDNVEQLVALAPRMVVPWLALAPEARLVVTSRERLRIDAEVCVQLEPLPVPETDARSIQEIGASEAVALFVARARAVRAGFELTEADAEIVAAIVRRIDGIPLAVELCAARIGVLAPKQILARLARRFDLLGAGSRGAPARQATLRGAIDWSWELLDAAEKQALAQCSVFRGGFSLDAAEGVINLGGAAPVLDVIQALYDKSLLQAHDIDGARRYRLLESIRAYAEEKLDELDAAHAALRRHAAFYVTAHPPEGLRAIATEADNLVAACSRALSWSDAATALQALILLEPVYARGRLDPYVVMLDAALAEAPASLDPTLRARSLYTRALADLIRGQILDCLLGFQRALDAARTAGSRRDESLALTKLGLLLDRMDQIEEAEERFDAARLIALDLGDPAITGDYLFAYAGALMARGRAAEGAAYAEQAVATLRPTGDLRGQSIALAELSQARLSLGSIDEAERASAAALAVLEVTEDRRIEGYVLAIVGRIALARGQFDVAREKLRAALAIHHAVGDRWAEGVIDVYLGNAAFEEGRFEEARSTYHEALTALRDSGERHYPAFIPAALAAVEISLGRDDAAAPHLQAAARAREEARAQSTKATVDVLAGFMDVALARQAARAGDDEAAARHRGAASARIVAARSPSPDGSLSPADTAEDVRFAIRLLEKALESAAPVAAASTATSARQPLMVVGPEARWFRVLDREPVHLLKSRAARLVLFRLVKKRLEAPGHALSLDALFEAGWPGEKIARAAAANRVHVTLTKLRQLGLAGLLQSRDDGFLLDPAAVVLEALGADQGR